MDKPNEKKPVNNFNGHVVHEIRRDPLRIKVWDAIVLSGKPMIFLELSYSMFDPTKTRFHKVRYFPLPLLDELMEMLERIRSWRDQSILQAKKLIKEDPELVARVLSRKRDIGDDIL